MHKIAQRSPAEIECPDRLNLVNTGNRIVPSKVVVTVPSLVLTDYHSKGVCDRLRRGKETALKIWRLALWPDHFALQYRLSFAMTTDWWRDYVD